MLIPIDVFFYILILNLNSIGGPIRRLCIDPTGQRLVVNFEERENPGCELLGLFSILRKPYLRYQPM